MKPYILSAVIITMMLYACKKNDENPDCPMNKVIITGHPSTNQTIIYEYDNAGRVTKEIHTPYEVTGSLPGSLTDVITYAYFNDSVVETRSGFEVTTFYLDSAGLATSARITYPYSNPSSLGVRSSFTYDADGYMTEERTIFSQLFNGSVLNDTSYIHYTITNGNITRLVSTQSQRANYDYVYEYGASDNITNNAFTHFHHIPGSWLGKESKNLPARIIDGGTVFSEFSYDFSTAGRLLTIKQNFVPPSSSIEVTSFKYECN